MPYLQTNCITENIQVTEGCMLASSDFNVRVLYILRKRYVHKECVCVCACVCARMYALTHTYLIWMVTTASQDSI